MAERPPPHVRPPPNRTARTNTIGVRRNLFQSNLTRRPTPTNSGSSNNSTETLRLGDVEVLSDTSEIVIRDKNGEFEVGDPPTPPPDDLDDGGALDDAQESERERKRLAEVLKPYQEDRNRPPVHPEEILELLKASLKANVAALAEDNWMYEPEEQPRPQ